MIIDEIKMLYNNLLESWNKNNALEFSNLFDENGSCVGFDGSQINGRNDIYDQIQKIFASHKVSSYTGIIREVRSLSPEVYLLRAVAGMVPPGKDKIKAAVNTVQTLIAQKKNEEFLIAIYQNTPAAFHGRPELSEQLTKELQEAYDKKLKM